MKRLSVVVLQRDERVALRALGYLGATQLERSEAGPETAPQEPPDRSGELARCADLSVRIDALCRRLDLREFPPAGERLPETSLEEIDRRVGEFEHRAVDLVDRRDKTRQRWAQVTALVDQVSLYEGIDVPLEQLSRLSFLHFAIGGLPEKNIETLEGKVGGNVVLLPLGEREGRRRLVVVTSRKGRFALETALSETDFHRESLEQPLEGSASAIAEQASREKGRLAAELVELDKAAEALGRTMAQDLANLRVIVAVEQQILEAEQNFPRTDSTVLITGWIPADDVTAFRQYLQEWLGGRCVVTTEDPADVSSENVPVLLRSPRFLRPFEWLVSAYGLPSYRELAPTLFVAITFLVMFGMMFGDVGHGLVFVVGGVAARLVSRRPKVRDAGVVVASAGVASMIFGLLYGDYFGFEVGRFTLWNNPLHGKPLELMATAIGFGVLVITLGIFLNIVNRFRRGDYLGGFLDKFGAAGAILYWAALVTVFRLIASGERPTGLQVVLLMVLPLLAIFFKEPLAYVLARRAGHKPHAESLFEALFTSAVEVFEALLSYMANTISFIRLAAYAMSHAAILYAAIMLGEMVHRAAGGSLGGVLFVLVIILGNLGAILLEGVIASVQALRLEYYEFFSKFFSGTGRAFKPFRLGPAEKD
jgi:V/A-type H+-transporting ATPase subunit I